MLSFLSAKIGYLVGALCGILLILAGILFLRNSYSIEGTAVCNNQSVLRAEVSLLTTNALARLTARDARLKAGEADVSEKVLKRLKSEFASRAQDAKKIFAETKAAEGDESQGANALKNPPSEKEKAEVQKRLERYAKNAEYCRARAKELPAGRALYDRGAEFWEAKRALLAAKGRLVFDEAEWNYEIKEAKSGLGNQTVDLINKVRRLEPEELAKLEVEEAPVGEEKVPIKAPTKNKFVATDYIDTNAIMQAASQVCAQLAERRESAAKEEDEILINGQLERVMTDDNGKFVFAGRQITPGEYGIYLYHELLTAAGDEVPVRWLVPVSVKRHFFSWNKVTKVTLDEKNMSDIPNVEAIPDKLKIYADFLDELKKEAATIK